MKLLVIGSGMTGSAAPYDMARQDYLDSVTLADNDRQRAKELRPASTASPVTRKSRRSRSTRPKPMGRAPDEKPRWSALRHPLPPEPRPGKCRHQRRLPFRRSGRQQHRRPPGTGARQAGGKERCCIRSRLRPLSRHGLNPLVENGLDAWVAATTRSNYTSEVFPRDPCSVSESAGLFR